MTTRIGLAVLAAFIVMMPFPTPCLGAGPAEPMQAATASGTSETKALSEKGLAAYKKGEYKEAAEWYGKAAEQGDAQAQFLLGMMYAKGEGVAKDPVEAVKWDRKAAEQGDSRAQVVLATFYRYGEGVAKDPAEAVRWYGKAAEQGDVQAQFSLAGMYADGEGVTKDAAEAVKWYRKAAEQGDAGAQVFLASRYRYGDGVAKDSAEAAKWYRKAAEQGLDWAQLNLARMYYTGEGVAKDSAEAAKWYMKAAEQGDVESQRVLGQMYDSGEGVTKDPAEAVKWYAEAGEQGDFDAQFSLYVRFMSGDGVRKDPTEAIKWLYRMAAQENAAYATLARCLMGDAYLTGEGVNTDFAAAAICYRMAAEGGSANAQFNLAGMYADGKGVMQSVSVAVEWYYKAGQSFVRNGDKEKALTCYDRIRSLSPDSHLAPKLYAEIYQGAEGAAQGGGGSLVKPDEKEQGISSGTGWVAEQGFIVTSNHVVSGRMQLTVRFADGKEAKATVAAADSANDLALLKIEGGGTLPIALPVAKQSVETGESVFTVGYPHPELMGAEAKVSEGIVSGNTGIGGDVRTLQISVPVQAGNSGAPLLNMKGEVVGIVVAKLNAIAVFAWTGDLTENVNYAIKTGYLKALLESAPKGNPTAGTVKAAEAALPELAARVKQSVVLIVAQ